MEHRNGDIKWLLNFKTTMKLSAWEEKPVRMRSKELIES